MDASKYQELSVSQKQKLCLYYETHGLCNPAKYRHQPKGNGCFIGFDQGNSIWCSNWGVLDDFKTFVILRSKNESQ
jgi:hypothetical protein